MRLRVLDSGYRLLQEGIRQIIGYTLEEQIILIDFITDMIRRFNTGLWDSNDINETKIKNRNILILWL